MFEYMLGGYFNVRALYAVRNIWNILSIFRMFLSEYVIEQFAFYKKKAVPCCCTCASRVEEILKISQNQLKIEFVKVKYLLLQTVIHAICFTV